MVLRITHPFDEPDGGGTVHETDGAVMAEEEGVRHFADRGPTAVGMSADGHQ